MFNEEKNHGRIYVIATIVIVAIIAITVGIVSRLNRTAVEAEVEENLVVITDDTANVSATTVMSTSTGVTSMTTDNTSTTDITTTTGVTTSREIETIVSNGETYIVIAESNTQPVVPLVENHPIIQQAEALVVDEPIIAETVVITSTETTTPETTTTTTTEITTTTETTTTTTTTTEPETTTTETTTTTVNNDETYLGNFRITGYVATGCKTASGTWPQAGRTIAMNKSQMNNLGLKYGDQIRIDGLGTYTLEDCGCKSGRIDVFCNSVSECYALPSYLDAYLVNN